ncbi:MAG: ADP-ribosylglycohydrolase family protein [Chloroflexota bacterium]
MLGAIAGDIIGSIYERNQIKTTEFPLFQPHCTFTDDTVLTVAVADAILHNVDYGTAIKRFGRKYPNAGYGGTFFHWLHQEESQPYNSWGNGSAMRVSPVGFAFDTVETVLAEAEKSAAVTHNHPEGIKGAQATALTVFLARTDHSKAKIKQEISERFEYDLTRTLAEIRPTYRFDVSCQGTVPQALTAFLESTDVEDAIRKAISLGGDSDTLACIAGGMAEAFYGEIPAHITTSVREKLPPDLLQVVDQFSQHYSA